jgi:hypothetical protein
MNLRLSAAEVRLRVDRKEAEALARGEPLEQEIAFPGGGTFRYRLEPTPGALELAASLSGTALNTELIAALELSIRVSAEAVRDLLVQRPSKDARLSAQLPTADGGALQLTVEIDLFSDGKGPRRK